MIQILPVPGLPEVGFGQDLGQLICGAADLHDGDVVVVSQKIVSKAEGAVAVPASGADPAAERRRLARQEAVRVVADTPAVLIVETRHGFVCANAGVDASNATGVLTLLPEDPDASAMRIRRGIQHLAGVDVAVVVADTFGRPWRMGQTEVAIGVAGMRALRDERGGVDRDGQLLEVTEIAVADELAAAADLARDKSAGIPVVIVRGFAFMPHTHATARDLVRPAGTDLFRRGRGGIAAELANPGAGPEVGASAVAEGDLEIVRRIAPDAVAEGGGPTSIVIADPLRAGLVVGALVDLGYAVRYTAGPPVIVTAGGSETSTWGESGPRR